MAFFPLSIFCFAFFSSSWTNVPIKMICDKTYRSAIRPRIVVPIINIVLLRSVVMSTSRIFQTKV
jgi:hypothetical protein